MDITGFIVSQREKALLVGDYGTYRKQLSRRLLVVRKKLKYTTPKGRKYVSKIPFTAEDIGRNHEYVHPILLTSERAWAQAMHMKATSSAGSGAKGVTGSTKSHIRSRLHKATIYASRLVTLLMDKDTSKATAESLLEARAYHVSLLGTLAFEKNDWEDCLHAFSEARLIYSSIAKLRGTQGEDIFRDLLNTTIDPSIRYASYQLKLPRTVSIDSIVLRYVQNNEFLQELTAIDPEAMQDSAKAQKGVKGGTAEDLPKTITWRSRTVDLQDAATAQALAVVSKAEMGLSSYLSSNQAATPQAKAAAYDEVLIPSQDAVDATKTAIDELSAEGVPHGDARMQALQITRTAVNYALVGWRIGRNRILCGGNDGALFEPETRQPKKSGEEVKTRHIQAESIGRKLTRLKERIVLYDSIMQSLDSVKALPGVAADQGFIQDLDATRVYFAALRCLSIARSHAVLSETKNALALLSRANDLASRITRQALSSQTNQKKSPNLEVTTSQVEILQNHIQSLLTQHRALVDLHSLQSTSSKAQAGKIPPLIEHLDEYPQYPLDLGNLVTYPPRIEPIPVKPIFLDVAFNYIDYPGRTRKNIEDGTNGVGEETKTGNGKNEGKKGWFGFGR
ncbi:hypothetical protein MMC21_006210 [Puttea exsequens]|nr:hypothetical protein [Puttea exsequens]